LATNIVIRKRRDNICELLKEKNMLLISEISLILNISKATVRRDIIFLKIRLKNKIKIKD